MVTLLKSFQGYEVKVHIILQWCYYKQKLLSIYRKVMPSRDIANSKLYPSSMQVTSGKITCVNDKTYSKKMGTIFT